MSNNINRNLEWYGKIPINWEKCRLKNIANITNGTTPSRNCSSNFSLEKGINWIKPEDLNNNIYITRTKEKISSEFVKNSTILNGKTILVNCVGDVGKCGVVDGIFSFNQQINAVQFNNQIYFNFGKWLMFAMRDFVIYSSQTNLLPFLSLSRHRNLKCFIPPLEEQIKIANYLDDKISKIDETIENNKKSIELLEEYKKSKIFELVTRGFSNDNNMVHINNNFLSQIPKDWKMKRLKYVIDDIKKGSGITKDEVKKNGDTCCVRYGEIYTKYNDDFSECISKTDSKNISSKQYFSKGDILFAATGELIEEIGKNVVYTGEEKCLAGGDIIYIKHHQNPLFLNYALNSNYCQAQKSCDKFKLKVVHLHNSDVANIRIALPSIDKQEKIANYIYNNTKKIDRVIEYRKQIIEKLEEYKKSLIYEAVTGKIEV